MVRSGERYICYFLMYLFYYLSLALFSGLLSVYLMDLGFRAAQISLLVSVQYVLSMGAQLIIGRWFDHSGVKKGSIILMTLAAASGFLFARTTTFILLVISYGLAMALMNGVNPAIEKMATTSHFSYGSIRIWGTVGYAVGLQTGGLLYRYVSPSFMYSLFSVSVLICLAGFSGAIGMTDRESPDSGETDHQTSLRLLLNPAFLYYLILVALFYGTTNVNTTYLPSMYKSFGLEVDTISTITFLGTLMELPLILLTRRFMNRFGNRELLTAVFLLLAFQFAIYAFVPWIPAKAAATILTKSVATMTFIMLNIKLVASVVDPSMQLTALAVVASFKSLISIVFQYASGLILDHMSYVVFYGILFICACAGAMLSLLFRGNNGKDLTLFR